ncbi:unnamed protein product [Soboliphyme baturini]|uniref:UBIQUITIN_CONJUGAT_2 domain-containing protein n=1 Tax=Soboliphyme baturini TaxID=241478 RepID=A0A183II48_9BILA|nr:unnamed protein product [Soboliphyme baturini]
MSDIALQRIQREFKEVTSAQEMAETGISVLLDNDNFHNIVAEIRGPPNTPYESGTFKLKVEIPDTYPFQPPKVRFLTRIWHPNISSATGAICLDALLCSPEPSDPQDAVVARQFLDNYWVFCETARFWAQYFAGGRSFSVLHPFTVKDSHSCPIFSFDLFCICSV